MNVGNPDLVKIQVKLQKLKHLFYQIEDMIYDLDDSLTQTGGDS